MGEMGNIHINPIAQRVQDGTVFGGGDLCGSCRWAVIRKSALTGCTETRCAQLPNTPQVRTKIAQCSSYTQKNSLTLHEMSDIAWVIEVKGKHIGFLTPEELLRRQRQSGYTDNQPPRVGF